MMIDIESLKSKDYSNIELDSNENRSFKDIAIVGIAFDFPGASSVEEFWNILCNRKDCVIDVPQRRKKLVLPYLKYKNEKNEKLHFKKMGFLNNIDCFDYKFFGLSPKESQLMDPIQRRFLEVSFRAMENGGYGGERLKNTNTGVYLGFNFSPISNYLNMICNINENDLNLSLQGNMTSMIPSRLSYLMNFSGPSMVIDTACSSSLVALHTACRALENKEIDTAIVSSSEITLFPFKNLNSIGIESSSEKSKSFDNTADGTGEGEGVVSILIKPLQAAIEDQDYIYSVIKGSAINQDGNSIGLTAPNPSAQAKLIKKAWEKSGIDPKTINYIETHGTATNLGDPIEIQGITQAFKNYTNMKHFCGLGAVKSNIGHLGAAAGLAGIIKGCLSLKYQKLAPIVHLNIPNKKINFENSPVYLCSVLEPWERVNQNPLRCGISSFGLSGTNAHVILEEYIRDGSEILDETSSNKSCIFTLSAKSKNSLKKMIKSYIEFLDNSEDSIESICYSTNIGKGQYCYRISEIVEDKDQLVSFLKEQYFTSIKSDCRNFYFVEKNKKLNIKSMSLTDIKKIYLYSTSVDWESYYQNSNINYILVPEYQFENTHCWINIPETKKQNSPVKKENNKKTKVLISSDIEFSKTAQKIADIWGEILGYNKINIHDNFFSLGGDSIMAVQIIDNLKRELNLQINLNEFLKNPTLYEMSSLVSKDSEKNIYSKFQKTKKSNDGYYKASYAQKRMYVSSVLEENSIGYNMFGAFRITGEFNLERAEKVINNIIKRHESLRTSFEFKNEDLYQKVNENISVDFTVISGKVDIKDAINSFICEFDLKNAPLIRVNVIKVNSKEHIMVIDMHHIISDGTSLNIFVKEFTQIYNGETLELPKYQYRDFSEWQNSVYNSTEFLKQKQFWLKKFQVIPQTLKLPMKQNAKDVKHIGGSINLNIDVNLTKDIIQNSNIYKTSVYNYFLMVLNILLKKITRDTRVVIGTVTSGRNFREVQGIIGMFVNTIPLINYIYDDQTIEQLLNKITQNSFEAFSNEDFPYNELIKELPVDNLFNVMFTFQNSVQKKIEIDNSEIKGINIDIKKTPYPLTFIIFKEKPNLYKIKIEYQKELFDKDTIQQIGSEYLNILRLVTKDLSQNVANIINEEQIGTKVGFNF